MKTKSVTPIRHCEISVIISCETATRCIIPDNSTGKRVRHVRKMEMEARDKAKEVCEILAKGTQQERALIADGGLKFELRRSLEILEPTGKRLLPATLLFAQAVSIREMPRICCGRANTGGKIARISSPRMPRCVNFLRPGRA